MTSSETRARAEALDEIMAQVEQMSSPTSSNAQFILIRRDRIRNIITAAILLAERRGAPQWQDIETAPKDGTPILGWPRDDEHATAYWNGCEWRIHCCGQSAYELTHWMPLPDSPLADEAPPATPDRRTT